jgi:hypothetical protein
MAENYMGYECYLAYGTAGVEADTELTEARDVKFDVSPKIGNTTSKGDGSSPPITTGAVCGLELSSFTFNMVNNGGANVRTLQAAARTGLAVSIKYLDKSDGKGLDADCYLKVSEGSPYEGEQTLDFEIAALSKGFDRTPDLDASA